jgi:hypothetical protein
MSSARQVGTSVNPMGSGVSRGATSTPAIATTDIPQSRRPAAEVLRTGKATVTIETTVDEATAKRFYALYLKTFGDLAVKAVARQVLHEHEFLEEMLDERVDKFLGRDDSGRPVAMCTLTRNLETVPWISPAYFSHHYPEQTARNAVFYLGFILVDHEYRRSHMFIDLLTKVAEMVIAERGLCAWDICSHNNEAFGLADAIEALTTRMATFEVGPVDTQTYYRALYLGPMKVPEMRNSG